MFELSNFKKIVFELEVYGELHYTVNINVHCNIGCTCLYMHRRV